MNDLCSHRRAPSPHGVVGAGRVATREGLVAAAPPQADPRPRPGRAIWLLAELERLRWEPGDPLDHGDGPDGWYWPILDERIPDAEQA